MGDRTTVELNVKKADYDRDETLQRLIEENDGELCWKNIHEGRPGIYEEVMSWVFEDVNYAELRCSTPTLEEYLLENNIEYDKSWAAGGDYPEGNEVGRLIDGQYLTDESYHRDYQESKIEVLSSILNKIEEGMDLNSIRVHINQEIDEVKKFKDLGLLDDNKDRKQS